MNGPRGTHQTEALRVGMGSLGGGTNMALNNRLQFITLNFSNRIQL